jgi:hypothetical protein
MLICQLTKDDLTFDAYEITTPYSLTLRFKVYTSQTLRMISTTDIDELTLKRELIKEKMSYLMESHKREELAKYVV